MRPTDQEQAAIEKIVCHSYIVSKRKRHAVPGRTTWNALGLVKMLKE